MQDGKVTNSGFPKGGSSSAVVGKNKRRAIPLVSATLTIVGSVIAFKLTQSLDNSQSWAIVGAWIAAGIIVTYLLARVQARSQEERPEAIKERVSQLEPELRKQVQARSYGTRRRLIEAPLRELDLDITPRMGWVRDPRLLEPEPISEKIAPDIVAAFESSRRRILIVGEPGSGKTMAAYSLIEYLDEAEGDERIPLLVNLSAWEAQENFEAFLVDYLGSSVGYEVPERALASAFISSDGYDLILDGLDEIPAALREHFSERLDEYVRGLPGEVGVVVTCRTQEYEELLAAHATGLGLVQAVEMLPLTSEQLDSALRELAKVEEDWGAFLSQRHLTASQRARNVLSNPLFLNLAVAGRLRPGQLLECDQEQEVRDLVLESYLDSTLADQRDYESQDARRYLSWIARFLNGDEISPFGIKTSDYTVFDLADLTPPEPPWRYRLFEGLGLGLVGGLSFGQNLHVVWWLVWGLGVVFGLVLALVLALPTGWLVKRSAVSSRLTLASWPSTRRQLLDLLRRAGRGVVWGLGVGLFLGLFLGLGLAVIEGLGRGLGVGLFLGLALGLSFALALGGLGFGLLETRSVLITSRTPKEARSRSLIAALTWLASGLVGGLFFALFLGLGLELFLGLGLGGPRSWRLGLAQSYNQTILLGVGLVCALFLGLDLALRNGGWFVLLQKVAHRRLARAGSLPSRPYDFLEWGIEKQIFRRVGGGVRFRHNLIQQHLANTSKGLS
jgi:MFS family permease